MSEEINSPSICSYNTTISTKIQNYTYTSTLTATSGTWAISLAPVIFHPSFTINNIPFMLKVYLGICKGESASKFGRLVLITNTLTKIHFKTIIPRRCHPLPSLRLLQWHYHIQQPTLYITHMH